MAYVQGSPFTEQQRQDITRRLQERGFHGRCPMCGNQGWALLEGYINIAMQPSIGGGLVIGGPTVPAIAIACTKCGFVSQHAAGALGLLPSDSQGGR